MRAIEPTGQFRRDFKREKKGSTAPRSMPTWAVCSICSPPTFCWSHVTATTR